MANPDYGPGEFFKWKYLSRVDAQLEAQRLDTEHRREVYRAVTVREGSRCRVCDAFCDPTATTMLRVGHHHHIVYESAGGLTTVENVCLLCSRCHNDEHMHRLRIEGNAQEEPWLTLWKRDKLGLVGERGEWFIWKREIGHRIYEHD